MSLESFGKDSEGIRMRSGLVSKIIKGIWIVLLGIISIFRIFIQYYFGYIVVTVSPYDDSLMMHSAGRLVNIIYGAWLGPYSKMTLAKGYSFPVFVAGAHFIHVPYNLAFGLLIIFAAVIFTFAFRRCFSNIYTAGISYLFILFNPASLGLLSAARIYRNSISPEIVLIIISCSAAIFLRRKEGYKKLIPWSILLTVSLIFFYFLREDSIWILPLVIVAAILSITAYFENKKPDLKRIFITVLPLICLPLSILLFSFINYLYYGIFTVNDRTGGGIAYAVGQMILIDDGSPKDDAVWVSRKQFEMAIECSPTLRELDPVGSYNAWCGGNEDADLGGDIVYWMIRDAAEQRGYYQENARETDELFMNIGNELESAFEDGRLEKLDGIVLSSQCRPFYSNDFKEAFLAAAKIIPLMDDYYDCNPSGYSVTGNEDIDKWEKVLRMDIGSSADIVTERREGVYSVCSNILKWYKASAPYIRIVTWALMAFITIYLIYSLIRHKRIENIGDVWIIYIGLLFTEFIEIYITYLFTMWLSKAPDSDFVFFYANPGYIMSAVMEVLAISGCVMIIKKIISDKKKEGIIENEEM